jgi:non-heme chloroperoxidase
MLDIHGISRHAKVWQKRALLSAVPPLMVQTPAHPAGHRNNVFTDLQPEPTS